MKPAILLFLKTFAYMTVAYSSMQALTYSFLGSGDPRFTQSFIAGIGFGLMMAIFFTLTQVSEVKKLKGKDFTTEDLSVHQAAHFQSPLSKAEILEKLQSNYPTKDWELKEEADLIKLKTSFTAKTFGEKITIKVNQLQHGFSEVLVESKPKTWFTLVDYGKNLKNIAILCNLMAA